MGKKYIPELFANVTLIILKDTYIRATTFHSRPNKFD